MPSWVGNCGDGLRRRHLEEGAGAPSRPVAARPDVLERGTPLPGLHGRRADRDGVGQARRSARLLASLKPDAIVASDLKRAASTAAELAALTGLEVTHDESLRETYAGVWQGLTHEEIIARHGRSTPPGSAVSPSAAAEANWRPRSPTGRPRWCCATPRSSRRTAPSWWSVTVARSAPPSDGCSASSPATGEPRWSLQLLLVRPRRGRARVASPGAQRGHASRTGPRRRRLTPPHRVSGHGFHFPAGRRLKFFLFARRAEERAGYSSVGRAPAWHAGGQEFNSP